MLGTMVGLSREGDSMASDIFNEQMSHNEAQLACIIAMRSAEKSQIDKILSEYENILPKISKREADLVARGWIVD